MEFLLYFFRNQIGLWVMSPFLNRFLFKTLSIDAWSSHWYISYFYYYCAEPDGDDVGWGGQLTVNVFWLLSLSQMGDLSKPDAYYYYMRSLQSHADDIGNLFIPNLSWMSSNDLT